VSYHWELGEGIPDGFRRIAGDELDHAIASLSAPEEQGIEAAVHDVRKRCKKLRGLARLVRPGLGGTYRRINDAARDAGRDLSPIRDAHAILGCFDNLLARTGNDLDADTASAVRAELSRRAREASVAVADTDTEVRSALDRLVTLRSGVADWSFDDDFRIVASAVSTTYRRGRDAMRQARRQGDDETLHEWRKREKDLWYAVRLLTPSAPAVLGPTASALHALSEDLGNDHDLVVLASLLDHEPGAFGGSAAVEATLTLTTRTRASLQEHAFGLGVQLYAERPDAFARRLRAYWKGWARLGLSLPGVVGEP